MIRSIDIKKQRDELTALEVVTKVFSEVASKHMLETRNSVLFNRDFLDGLTSLFDEVRDSYSDEIKKIASGRNQKKGSGITFLSHNGKKVLVFFSANKGLYGAIVRKTFDLFKQSIVENPNYEITVVGEVGKALFESEFPDKTYTFFSLSDEEPSKEQLTTIARHIVQYDEMNLYFGKFQNIVIQNPEKIIVSSTLDTNSSNKSKNKYLFEPALESVLVFFESELFGSILKQTIEESRLSKLASRVFAMDEASNKISLERKRLLVEEFSTIHREANKKQLNSLSGILSLV